DGIRDFHVTGVQTCALPISLVLNQNIILRPFFRVFFLMPMMMMPIAVGYTGRMMFQSSYASPIPDLLRDLQGILSTLPLIGDSEIGRASCRESVEISFAGVP